jgi:hypothetical protein
MRTSAVSYLSSAERHLDNAKAHIAVAESGDAKRAAYEQAADEILAAMADDSGLSTAHVAERIGKGQRWVQDLLKWRRAGARTSAPFSEARGTWDERKKEAERKVPTGHADRVEMATKLLADPEVAKGVMSTPAAARTVVQEAVREHNQGWKQIRKRQREVGAVPLPAIWVKLTQKIGEWGSTLHFYRRELAKITDDDLVGLNSYGRERVAKTLAQFNDRLADLQLEVNRWRYALEETPAIDELPVIDIAAGRR